MEDNILFLIKHLSLSLKQYGREQMKELGLSLAQSQALGYLLSQKGRTVYATELHEKFRISKSAISATLKGLKEKGYVKMAASPKDDRKKQIVLADKAYELQARIDGNLLKQQTILCRGIPQQRLQIMEDGLHAMIENLQTESERRNAV